MPSALSSRREGGLNRSGKVDRQAAHRLFAFSIADLFVLFAALLANIGTLQACCTPLK
jgi:heme O synthase-like polyprenyltransferase